MTADIVFSMSVTATIASGIIAGIFLTFSDFVMRALAATPTAVGMRAMQLINQTVYRSLFLPLFFGLAIIAILATYFAFSPALENVGVWMISGGAFYLLGVIGVTMFFNVPMNKQLDKLSADDTAGIRYWRVYLRKWTLWNHVRTLASGLSATCFLVSALLSY